MDPDYHCLWSYRHHLHLRQRLVLEDPNWEVDLEDLEVHRWDRALGVLEDEKVVVWLQSWKRKQIHHPLHSLQLLEAVLGYEVPHDGCD